MSNAEVWVRWFFKSGRTGGAVLLCCGYRPHGKSAQGEQVSRGSFLHRTEIERNDLLPHAPDQRPELPLLRLRDRESDRLRPVRPVPQKLHPELLRIEEQRPALLDQERIEDDLAPVSVLLDLARGFRAPRFVLRDDGAAP